ncbi:G-type lectin S-receptor Serine/Threonine-kinase [Trifolium repens]|nr:G-type lectin S-receptor Serine/Threonine-kinase [Trifolium repens]
MLNLNANFDQLDDISYDVYNLLTNFSLLIRNNKSIPVKYDNTRLFLDSTGMIQWVDNSVEGDSSVRVRWKQPKTNCSKYNVCGDFASCNVDDKCKCLPGFVDAGKGDSSLQNNIGCIRRTSITCTRNDTWAFLNLTMIKTRRPDIKVAVDHEENCTSICRETCPPCQAYSYAPPLAQRTLNSLTCWIWNYSLTTLKEGYTAGDDDRRLFVLVDKSDIEATPRTCEPCGTNIVPYPLSTGSNCGDLAYSNFSCNMSQLSFITNNDSYRVTRVLPSSRTFTIYYDEGPNFCEEGSNHTGNLKVSSPYSITSNNLCSEHVEVSWEPPSEPVCDNIGDCHGWEHSTCSKTNRCLCNANYEWNGESLSCIEKRRSFYLILGLTLTGVAALACIIIFGYACRRRIAHMFKKDKGNIQRNVRGKFYDSERHVKDLIDMEGLEENDNEGIEVPYFDFESILIATDDFSDANKLGKGGFGPVYKGKLGGQEIAVKRLSSVSSQGLQEFKNEVVLIAKLQHRNLVKLRGYCIKGEEKILIYEYLPNKSLDLLIFDPTKCVILDWQMWFDIILGIARGMLYLHQDSRLRVIHRDLKTSNILLDEEMQPKISDFGLARIFGGKEVEASTERIVGTYGYMSPEYALDGYFSTKSDVFSFGVVLFEIISGKRNTGFFRSKEISSLLGYAWRLWREEKLQDLMDPSLSDSYNVNQFIRCAQIALLCVQDEPDDRPHMSNVVTMLDNETTALLTPKQPTFFSRKEISSTASSSQQIESSIQEGR